ncbi:MAG TPA: hypothetical protein VFP43_02895 [Mesorhizobium sp.]|nr:hypothetical protein [Mesorhizobium sp.]
MADMNQRILAQIADLRRQMSNQTQVGTVHEVKGTKLRMSMGKDKDGKDILSPWLNTGNMRGGAREQRFYKKGQTLSLFAPGGDIAQGIIMPYAPNKKFKTPEHADGSGQDEESYQLADYREKQTKDGYDNWLQPDEEEKQDSQQSGQGGSGGGGQKQQKKGHVGGDKAQVKARMNKDGGHTLRVGKDSRVASHKDGAKIRMAGDYVVVSKGKIIFSQPPVLGKDPIKNDDA